MDEDPKSENRPEVGTVEELRSFLRDFDNAMLVTVTSGGFLRARPMAMQDPAAVPDCDLWFVTADESSKADEIREERQVNVCCLRRRDGAYASISARARIDDNNAEVKRLWRPEWKIWFGDEQPADNAISIIKLRVERAEYWAPEGGRLKVVYAMVKSSIGGETADRSLNPPKRIG